MSATPTTLSAVQPDNRAGRPAPGSPAARPLELRSLARRWRGNRNPVLDGLDLLLEHGTVTWVGGRNGAGKTTMLRVAAGLIEPETGTARVFGLAARDHRARYQQLVSFLPAGDRGLYARLTVRRQLEFWALISMLPRRDTHHLVNETISDFGLAELADRRVDRMSMGQRQRLRIAMTFMKRPRLVLLDEPLTSLDADGTSLLCAQATGLCARGGAVLWCSPTGERPGIPLDAAYTLSDGRLVPA